VGLGACDRGGDQRLAGDLAGADIGGRLLRGQCVEVGAAAALEATGAVKPATMVLSNKTRCGCRMTLSPDSKGLAATNLAAREHLVSLVTE
jgi:hypothetical protein